MVRASVSELSRTSGNALGLPTSACDTDLARRCDCISACPLAATWAALLLAEFSAATVITSRPTTPASTTPPRMRCCSATVRRPINGRLPAPRRPASRASGSSEGPPRSVGTASEMIDDSALPLRCTNPASKASHSARAEHRRTVRAGLEPQVAFVERRVLPRRDRISPRAVALAPSLDPVQQTHRCLVVSRHAPRGAQPTILRNASWCASSDR